MRKIIVAIALALVTFMTALTLSAQRFEPIDQLVVFGDSLSDTGTVFRATNGAYPPNPPYFQGRYSNGRVWVEYLADRLSLSTSQIDNHAYGGATSSSYSNGLVPGLLSQVQSFTQTHSSVNSTALYVVWAGANDYLQGVNDATTPVKNVIEAIASLSNAGAKRVLVANLPNLGQLPATRNTANSASLVALTQSHNQGLRRSLKVLGQQQPDLEIAVLDANALYQEAITHPAEFGFTNVTDAYISSSRACDRPQQFLFWDGIHPTTAAHQILGEQAFAAIAEHLPSNAGALHTKL
ncbi:SGNH/GDSL hydrolase family protein [Oculatella sp. FACHB-28]|uniref:SGNH/GDSL hydrolase family protein n=1 Tax=Oculatella sp. FACHB-28 TaxID=2692845 RepID=UPI0018F00E3D